LALIALLSGCSRGVKPVEPAAVVQPPTKILLIAQEHSERMEFMLQNEVAVMIDSLKTAGFQVVVATASGAPIHAGAQTLNPDCTLRQVSIGDYAGVVLPCMLALYDSVDPLAIDLVKQARNRNEPVAAQTMGVLILARAGALTGKHFATESGLEKLVHGGVYEGEGVVSDGDIVTSGLCPNHAQSEKKPDTTLELMRQFIDKVNQHLVSAAPARI
jgi:putative intracellular protease/amidase